MSRGVRHCHIDSGSYFQAYAQELTEEVGAINHELHGIGGRIIRRGFRQLECWVRSNR